MRKKQIKRLKAEDRRVEQEVKHDSFYSSQPAEQTLSEEGRGIGDRHVRKTGRHQSVESGRPPKKDERDMRALLALLKMGSIFIGLMIVFVALWKGLGIYGEVVLQEQTRSADTSPVLESVTKDDLDTEESELSLETFSDRVALWKEAEQLVRAADTLLRYNNYKEAISRCQEALRADPAHRGALERLGLLYYSDKDYVKAVNAYIRLLSVDPSDAEVQKLLIQSLAKLDDHAAVKYMSTWYLDQNLYDIDVARSLGNALCLLGEYEAAIPVYTNILKQEPKDLIALDNQSYALMQVGEYKKALEILDRLSALDTRHEECYKRIILCYVKLDQQQDAILAFGHVEQIFGRRLLISWLQDPQLDPLRDNRSFKSFVDRVAGKEFRLRLEDLAKTASGEDQEMEEHVKSLDVKSGESQNLELLENKGQLK